MEQFIEDPEGFTHFFPDKVNSQLGFRETKFHTFYFNYMEKKFQKSEMNYQSFLQLTTKLEVEEDVLQIFFQERFYQETKERIVLSKPKRRTDVCYPIRAPSTCRRNFGPTCCAFVGLGCSPEPMTSTPKQNRSSRKRLHVDVSPIRSNPSSSRSSSRSSSEDSPGPSSRVKNLKTRPSKASSVSLSSPNLPVGSRNQSEETAPNCRKRLCSTDWSEMF
ncbi:hypothetical protein CRE_18311 [Caenorhabditis remanei]|uniref:Uncharacterized protein n=1 Tax=Caenorhabditis remanei TaxID=31234 RepID=E3NPG8_CAERE|nr:hypothetical protein CRE_18311 [Caenorhabditis remanei]